MWNRTSLQSLYLNFNLKAAASKVADRAGGPLSVQHQQQQQLQSGVEFVAWIDAILRRRKREREPETEAAKSRLLLGALLQLKRCIERWPVFLVCLFCDNSEALFSLKLCKPVSLLS
jgi:hypothetical protein